MKEYIFVYGTLMSIFSNKYAHLLRVNSAYIGKAYTYGSLYDMGDYPVAIYTDVDKQQQLFGEVYQIKDKSIIEALDFYEEYGENFPKPNEYIRIKIPVVCGTEIMNCWFYNYNRKVIGLTAIPSGDYEDFYTHISPNIF